MGWINEIFRKKYYVWNEINKTVDVMSDFEFSVFIYKLKNPINNKIEIKENQTRRVDLNGEWFDISTNQMRIDYNNIDKILINYLKKPSKEEVFQIIEKLLTIETID